MAPWIATKPSARSKAGRHYVGANDKEIRNLGERLVPFVSQEGFETSVKFQTAEVSRVLISGDKLLEAGCDVLLSKNNPRIVDKRERVFKLQRRKGVFLLKMWLRVPNPPGFTRQER